MNCASTAPQNANLITAEFLGETPLPYLEIDRNGCILRANRAACELQPAGQEDLLGHMVWEMIAPNEIAPSFASYCALLESGNTPNVVRHTIFVRPGQFRTYELHCTLIHDAAGIPDGMRILGIDVTESVKTLSEVRTAALWLHSVVEAIPLPVLVANSIGLVCSVNPAAERLFGWLPHAMDGRLIEQAIPRAPYASRNETPIGFQRALQAPAQTRVTILDAQGAAVLVEITSAPIMDAQSGNLSGVVCILRKI